MTKKEPDTMTKKEPDILPQICPVLFLARPELFLRPRMIAGKDTAERARTPAIRNVPACRAFTLSANGNGLVLHFIIADHI